MTALAMGAVKYARIWNTHPCYSQGGSGDHHGSNMGIASPPLNGWKLGEMAGAVPEANRSEARRHT